MRNWKISCHLKTRIGNPDDKVGKGRLVNHDVFGRQEDPDNALFVQKGVERVSIKAELGCKLTCVSDMPVDVTVCLQHEILIEIQEGYFQKCHILK